MGVALEQIIATSTGTVSQDYHATVSSSSLNGSLDLARRLSADI
jgi:hypothetical protein